MLKSIKDNFVKIPDVNYRDVCRYFLKTKINKKNYKTWAVFARDTRNFVPFVLHIQLYTIH